MPQRGKEAEVAEKIPLPSLLLCPTAAKQDDTATFGGSSPPEMHLHVVFKPDLTGGLVEIEDAAQLGDHRLMQGLAFGGGVGA